MIDNDDDTTAIAAKAPPLADHPCGEDNISKGVKVLKQEHERAGEGDEDDGQPSPPSDALRGGSVAAGKSVGDTANRDDNGLANESNEKGENGSDNFVDEPEKDVIRDAWDENGSGDGGERVSVEGKGETPPPLNPDPVASSGSRPPNPLKGASVFSKMIFLWASPLLKVGSTRPLEEEDLPDLSPHDTSVHNRAAVEGLWEHERDTQKSPSLLRAIAWHYFKSMKVAQFLLILSMAARVGQALALGLLLEQFEDHPGVDTRHGYIWTGVLVLCGAVLFLSKQRQFFETYRGGMRLRIGLVGAIFDKALRLSSVGGVYEHTSGQVTNLASNDVERFLTTSVSGIYLLWGPLEAVVILVVGLQVIGLSFAAGYVCLLVFVPLQLYLSKRFAFLRSKVAALTDARVSIVSQAVTGSRVMKMNAWEEHFEEKILAAREKEVQQILKSSRYKALNEAIYFFSNIVVSVLIFSVHVARGGTLTSRNVYSTMALLNILQFTVAKQIPSALMGVAECSVSCRRIQSFLEAKDLPRIQTSSNSKEGSDAISSQDMVSMSGCTCYWNGVGMSSLTKIETEGKTSEVHPPVVALSDVSLCFRSKQLYFVVGKVGAGKSALLQAIAGELPLFSGKIRRTYSSLAYAPQAPWIMNGTIRDNVTMGATCNELWYRRVVEACDLMADFSRLSHGDLTIVGDRGIQLSGGQRARVGLARALFRDADILLLDDPLSAVDSKVGRLIFHKAIRELGVDRGKCVVLATHQHQYVGECWCILMNGGSIVYQGSYEDCAKMSDGMLDASLITNGQVCNSTSSQEVEQAGTKAPVKVSTVKDMMPKEDRTRGIVRRETWVAYARAMGGVWVGFGLFALFAATQASSLLSMVLMGKWAEATDQNLENWYVLIIGLVVGTVLLSVVRARLSFFFCIMASRQLHDRMTRAVLRARIEFFDTNPVGRILNRFAADVGITDELLPLTIYDFLVGFFIAIGSVATAIVVLPFILIALPALVGAFSWLRRVFVATTRELKRLEGLGRSPIYAMLSESMNGISCIRCNDAITYFRGRFEATQNDHTRAFFAFIASSRWFAIRIDMIAFTLMSLASLLAVLFNDQGWFQVEPAVLGLALTMLLQLAGTNFPWITRQSAEVVNQMVSTERITSFGLLPSEAELSKPKPDDLLRAKGWPTAGAIEAENLTVRYRESLPVTLHSVSFRIEPGHRVGVVGRTGSGKSTLVQTLFRLLEAENGCIAIDGADISTMGLHILRSRLSIIPQTPTLYSGCTIRENLDPFSNYSEENILDALKDVQMEAAVEELPKGLESMVSGEGTNLSVGQRQLLCLARAILCKNKILILDEATANCDARTDRLLQEAIAKRFAGATIIAVAHRLDTVIEFDRILVLGSGEVLAYGTPHELASVEGGHFSSMIDDTGHSMALELRKRASRASLVNVAS